MRAGGVAVVYAGGASAIVARVRGGVERLLCLRAERSRGELRAQVPYQLHYRRLPPAPHPVRVALQPATLHCNPGPTAVSQGLSVVCFMGAFEAIWSV